MSSPDRFMEVLKASQKMFARYGYKKTTMEEIAGELNMTKGALYLYARNKKNLYEKTVMEALARWQSRVRDAVDQVSGSQEKFKIMCIKAYQYLDDHEELRRILIHDPEIFPMFPSPDPYYDINENSRNMIRQVLKEGIGTGQFRPLDIESTTWFLFSIYKMFIIDTYVKADKENSLKLFQDAVDLVLYGLLHKKGENH